MLSAITPKMRRRSDPRATEKISGYVMRAFAGETEASLQNLADAIKRKIEIGVRPILKRSSEYFPGESFGFIFFFKCIFSFQILYKIVLISKKTK